MASTLGASIFSPSSSVACYQYGSRIPYSSTQKFPFLELSDIAHNSNSLSLAQIASARETTKPELAIARKTLFYPASDLPDPYPDLSPLISELTEGANGSSAMDPWLRKLALQDWDALVHRFAGTDWTTSWNMVSFLDEKASLPEESVLWPTHIESGPPLVERKDTEEGEDKEERQPYPPSEAIAETSVDGAQGEFEMGSKKIPCVLVLQRTLCKVLGRTKNFHEVDHLQEQMRTKGSELNFSIYSAMLNFYSSLTEKVSKKETAGFQPTNYTYKKEVSTFICAAWTRAASGQRPVKKNKKSWGQRVDKYMKPFMLDINISRRYLSAKVTHRVTGKVVAGCTTNAKDLRNSLPSLIDTNACKTVGRLLAERAKAADVFAVIYEPRKNEKLEGKLALILDTILENDIVLL